MRKIAKEANRVMSPAEQLLANAQLLVDIKRKQKKKSRAEFRKLASRFNAGRKAQKHLHYAIREISPQNQSLIQDLNYQNVSRNYFERSFSMNIV
jgi:hypothetical protein